MAIGAHNIFKAELFLVLFSRWPHTQCTTTLSHLYGAIWPLQRPLLPVRECVRVCVKNITHTPRATQKTERSETEASAADAAATVAVTALLSMRQCCCCCLLQKKTQSESVIHPPTPLYLALPSPAHASK